MIAQQLLGKRAASRGYVREVLAFVNWCRADAVTCARAWQWDAEPPAGPPGGPVLRINVGLLLVTLKKRRHASLGVGRPSPDG